MQALNLETTPPAHIWIQMTTSWTSDAECRLRRFNVTPTSSSRPSVLNICVPCLLLYTYDESPHVADQIAVHHSSTSHQSIKLLYTCDSYFLLFSFHSFSYLWFLWFTFRQFSWKSWNHDYYSTPTCQLSLPIHRNNELISPSTFCYCDSKPRASKSQPLPDRTYKRGQTPKGHKFAKCVVFFRPWPGDKTIYNIPPI